MSEARTKRISKKGPTSFSDLLCKYDEVIKLKLDYGQPADI